MNRVHMMKANEWLQSEHICSVQVTRLLFLTFSRWITVVLVSLRHGFFQMSHDNRKQTFIPVTIDCEFRIRAWVGLKRSQDSHTLWVVGCWCCVVHGKSRLGAVYLSIAGRISIKYATRKELKFMTYVNG
jgi:hypothetical protein